ncbi:MAG TPA: NAD(P)H-binding protein [Myxococcaceae bacterium]|nr:NAD(P)H-binding protein [Myxococcaceae bacterium]
MANPARKLFIAGATGAVGRTAVRLAEERGLSVVPHVRPKTAAQGKSLHPRAAVLELSDVEALTEALRDRTTVLQLIGTTRNRFARGDTYETSDIGTTRQLVETAKRTASIDHFILLSSVGAGRPFGAYLKSKARAEAIVRDSGIPFTIFRPSAFMGEGHRVPGIFKRLTQVIGARAWEPIPVPELAAALLTVAERREPLNAVLEGATLWGIVSAAHAA